MREHSGQFLCERIHAPGETKVVDFRHVIEPPTALDPLPDIGRLIDFYETFGSAVFYYDERSGDAARHIASPGAWGELADEFGAWLTSLDDQERSEILPDWVDGCLVIGEEPQTGNYILMPTTGESVGRVFLFDHDGFEFVEEAGDLIEHVERLRRPYDSMVDSRAARQPGKRCTHHQPAHRVRPNSGRTRHNSS